MQDMLVEVGNIEKRVRNLSKEKSGQEEQWSPVCSGSPDKCEWEVGLRSQSLWQCPSAAALSRWSQVLSEASHFKE